MKSRSEWPERVIDAMLIFAAIAVVVCGVMAMAEALGA